MLSLRQTSAIGFRHRPLIIALASFIFFSAIAEMVSAYSKREHVRLILISLLEHREYQGLALDSLGLGNLLVQLVESDGSQYVTKLAIERSGFQTLERTFSPDQPNRFINLGFNSHRIHLNHKDIRLEIIVIDSIGSTAFIISIGILATLAIWFSLKLILVWRERTIRYQVLAERERIAKQISHDIKSPLGALSVAISNFEKSPSSALDLIKNASQRIKAITDDLSNPSLREIHFCSISQIQSDIKEVSAEIDAKQMHSIELSNATSGLGAVKVNRDKLKRIISNVLTNAIEADPTEPIKVILKLNLDLNTLTISVEDDGKGMSPDVLDRIGTEGFSFGKADGSGLGLFDAYAAIREWGGRLDIDSKVGVGTKVSLLLPVHKI